jgi:sugar-specific transcriptional regulator TrmB
MEFLLGQVYILSIPVSDKEQARTLSASSTWKILEELREAGLSGMTAEEIWKRLELTDTTVYSLLSRLRDAGWVESRPDRKKIGRPDKARKREMVRTGRKKQIYVAKLPSDIELEGEFADTLYDALKDVLEKRKHELVNYFADAIDKILESMEQSKDGKSFFPSTEICKECHSSHEAVEFLSALSFEITTAIVNRFEKELKPILEKHGIKGAFGEKPAAIALP